CHGDGEMVGLETVRQPRRARSLAAEGLGQVQRQLHRGRGSAWRGDDQGQMKRSLFAVVGLALIATARGAGTNAPFAMNGWQFHDYDIPKLEEAVNRAPDYGVNFFIFSHEFFRSVEGFLASTDDVNPTNPPAWVKDLHTPEYFRIIPHWQSDLRH